SEVAIPEESHVEERIALDELPEHEGDQAGAGNDGGAADERAREPVLLDAAIEHHLERAEGESDECGARQVEVYAALPAPTPLLEDERRLIHHRPDEEQGQQAHRHVDEK